MAVDPRLAALIQHIQALEETKKALEIRKKTLEEALKRLESFGADRKIYLNVLGIVLVESSFDEAKKHIEDEIALLDGRIKRLERQIEELKTKLPSSRFFYGMMRDVSPEA